MILNALCTLWRGDVGDTILRRGFVILLSSALLLPSALRAAQPATAAKPSEIPVFFPFCIDWHDAKKRDFTEQAQMLKELGYPGVGHIWLDKLSERIQSLDAAGLKLFQITIQVDIGQGNQAYDPRLREAMALVKGRGVQFALLMNGMKPSDMAGDERAVQIIREIADLGQGSGAQFLLYPHTDFWMERIEDCVRLADKVNRPEVGVMFNLCHWLRVSKDRDYTSRLKLAMPRLMAVSLNGADQWDPQTGWGKYIQPLGQGNFDVASLLKKLGEWGFHGPIGLQCYGIGGDTRDHLQRSMDAWKKIAPPSYK